MKLAMSKFARKSDYWEYRCKRAEKLLERIYQDQGPGSAGGRGKEPIESYAALTKEKIDADWDFPERHLMHEIAVLLAERDGDPRE